MPRDALDRDSILAWVRQRPGLLREIVQEYRFARRQGEGAERGRLEASRRLATADPTLPDPMTCAVVLLEWMEREHRGWFWRCCRGGHIL